MPTQNRSARGKNVMKKAWQKVKQLKLVRVELRASGGLHGPQKPGWSASGKEK